MHHKNNYLFFKFNDFFINSPPIIFLNAFKDQIRTTFDRHLNNE